MNGNWEVNKSAWPIGYLKDNSSDAGHYHITDMRELKKIDARSVPLHKAEHIAAVVNLELRTKAVGVDIAARVAESIDEA